MTAQIINLRAWRLAHSEPASMYSAAAAQVERMEKGRGLTPWP